MVLGNGTSVSGVGSGSVSGVASGVASALPMEGALPPDLQGTLFRVGPGGAGAGGSGGHDGAGGALHAVELRDGRAVSYLRRNSPADAGVFWHAGSVLALPESGLPSRYDRFLEPQEFAGGLTVPIASHVHRVAADGGRVLFSVEGGEDDEDDTAGAEEGIWLRIGEWDAGGGLRTAQAVELERATWQHDIGVTSGHVVFIESPTTRLADAGDAAVPFGWVPGAEAWVGVVRRGGDGTGVRWFRVDPCLVTHVLGAWELDGDGGGGGGAGGRGGAGEEPEVVTFVCRYEVPEPGQGFDTTTSVVGPAGIGRVPIGPGLPVLERWRTVGGRLERTVLDERRVEYVRMDATLEGEAFRYGYGVELAWTPGSGAGPPPAPGAGTSVGSTSAADVDRPVVSSVGLLRFDLTRDEVASWDPGPGRAPSEPIFVRAADGRSDDEGWLLTVVEDATRGASDLYVLDASSLGRRGPEAVIHLPERLPFRSHGEWVPADRYR
jgi:carotenoid cleavage dioxygenase-like enzyme